MIGSFWCCLPGSVVFFRLLEQILIVRYSVIYIVLSSPSLLSNFHVSITWFCLRCFFFIFGLTKRSLGLFFTFEWLLKQIQDYVLVVSCGFVFLEPINHNYYTINHFWTSFFFFYKSSTIQPLLNPMLDPDDGKSFDRTTLSFELRTAWRVLRELFILEGLNKKVFDYVQQCFEKYKYISPFGRLKLCLRFQIILYNLGRQCDITEKSTAYAICDDWSTSRLPVLNTPY